VESMWVVGWGIKGDHHVWTAGCESRVDNFGKRRAGSVDGWCKDAIGDSLCRALWGW